ncbi:MAG: hypothetical protein U9Q92_02725 [archaeon]|nr:hypothetical protein [archaeon]
MEDVKEYRALGLQPPPTSIAMAMRSIFAVDFRQDMESDIITALRVRDTYKPVKIATLEEVLDEEALLLHQTNMDRKSDCTGSLYQRIMADMAIEEMMFAGLGLRQITTPVSVDATCNDTIVSMAGVDGQEAGLEDITALAEACGGVSAEVMTTVGHMSLGEAQEMKTQDPSHYSCMHSSGSAAA